MIAKEKTIVLSVSDDEKKFYKIDPRKKFSCWMFEFLSMGQNYKTFWLLLTIFYKKLDRFTLPIKF